MKIFFDTEFTGLTQDTDLISIGFVTEDGRSLYAEINDFDMSKVDSWIKSNVIDNLLISEQESIISKDNEVLIKSTYETVQKYILNWLDEFEGPIEFWSDCLAYDWVLLCEFFGGGIHVPININYIPFDICTYFKIKNINPDISREKFIDTKINGKKHNSLYDAKVIKACYEKLEGM